jgi:hypothetical protein
MKTFTVIGYWPSSMQRFAEFIDADDPDSAEEMCVAQYPGIAVCGVLAGKHQCIDAREIVRMSEE